ncbi:Fur family transcriptional regulator [Prauserella cavernicola]|uniref:Transcriptional repressor n=1 Tax=Prauserella cavernicola TaxID=2800127 RepID=A0A934V1M1_9PSEU|nr:Fur family transcriptional regulator [Prauserella cavernicola]MBK1783491.1 transcriptional repressor [Prauserella cavernicola]
MPGVDGGRDTAGRLRAVGLRVTAPRRAVLGWLEGHPHATAEQVRAGVRDVLGSVSHQAVYDVLKACTTAGLVRTIQPAGHPTLFETRVADNHHHLVCRGCGRTEDVDCVPGAAPCLAPDDSRGFGIAEAEIVFWGWCPACTASKETTS